MEDVEREQFIHFLKDFRIGIDKVMDAIIRGDHKTAAFNLGCMAAINDSLHQTLIEALEEDDDCDEELMEKVKHFDSLCQKYHSIREEMQNIHDSLCK